MNSTKMFFGRLLLCTTRVTNHNIDSEQTLLWLADLAKIVYNENQVHHFQFIPVRGIKQVAPA